MPATESGNESVTQEYLSRDTLVLCVVDTDSETLDPGNAALHAISMAGKIQQTILVLTKADKVDQDEVEEALFDRVLKTAAKCQHFDQLKGVVAVINRKHTDQISLEDAADQEDERFDAILAGAAGHYATAEVQEALRAGIKTQQLLKAMGELYHDYMVHSWRDQMLAKIHVMLDEANAELRNIGPAPNSITAQAILDLLHDEVWHQILVLRIAGRRMLSISSQGLESVCFASG